MIKIVKEKLVDSNNKIKKKIIIESFYFCAKNKELIITIREF